MHAIKDGNRDFDYELLELEANVENLAEEEIGPTLRDMNLSPVIRRKVHSVTIDRHGSVTWTDLEEEPPVCCVCCAIERGAQ